MLHFQPAPGQFGPEVREPGLMVWRVEKMKAVLLEPAEFGAFFNGDSYLVLEHRGDQGADLHMWIGKAEGSCRDLIEITTPLGILSILLVAYSHLIPGVIPLNKP